MRTSSFLVALTLHVCQAQVYEDVHDIHKDLFDKNRYHTHVVPKSNQSEPLYVTVSFGLVSIVSVDDVIQSFTCNGVYTFTWTDEKLRWNPSDYGGQTLIHPEAKLMWRPRVVLINTLGSRDPFGDDESPTTLIFNGSVQWIPGSLFEVSCSLSLLKYPFDEQQCTILMLSMGLQVKELIFIAGDLNLSIYTLNGEWELLKTWVETNDRFSDTSNVSRIEVSFRIKRRPTIYVVNYILPVVFLSLLNMAVFFIPAESGEKIGYGITVVLAISVFLSQVSELLPRSSDQVPYVTIYLFSLYLVSVLTALDAIFIVFMHHLKEKAVHRQNVRKRLRSAVGKVSLAKKTVRTLREKAGFWTNAIYPRDRKIEDKDTGTEDDHQEGSSEGGNDNDNYTEANTFKLFGGYIDLVSFILFLLAWSGITLWFFISVSV